MEINPLDINQERIDYRNNNQNTAVPVSVFSAFAAPKPEVNLDANSIDFREFEDVITEETEETTENHSSINNIFGTLKPTEPTSTEHSGVNIEKTEEGCIVTSINSQEVDSQALQTLSQEDIAAIGDNGFSTTLQGSDDVIKGNINQALSTQNVHNCACLALYNDETETQILYHVFAGTQSPDKIAEVIQQVMPEGFNRATIVPGDNQLTEGTVNMIYSSLNKNYPDTEISFMHSTIEHPVLVSYNGQMYQAESLEDETLFPVGKNINPNEPPYSIEQEDAITEECSK